MTRIHYHMGEPVKVRTKHYGTVRGRAVEFRPNGYSAAGGSYLVMSDGVPSGRVDADVRDMEPDPG